MRSEVGNMFNTIGNIVDEHMLVVTTNSFIRRDGALVMGRGAAKQLATLYPDMPWTFASKMSGSLCTYSLLWTEATPFRPALGAFQVKRHYADDACIKLIRDSTLMLSTLAQEKPKTRFDMNYPGIGNGRLSINDVGPLLRNLPDNVHVWTFY